MYQTYKNYSYNHNSKLEPKNHKLYLMNNTSYDKFSFTNLFEEVINGFGENIDSSCISLLGLYIRLNAKQLVWYGKSHDFITNSIIIIFHNIIFYFKYQRRGKIKWIISFIYINFDKLSGQLKLTHIIYGFFKLKAWHCEN